MVRFRNSQHPAAISYAVVGTDPERAEPDAATLLWRLEWKNRQLENENRLLWTMLALCWVCWAVSLLATVWLAG